MPQTPETINRTKIRSLAIKLLDDENGINKHAFYELRDLLILTDNDDICKCVKADLDRFYITEDQADVLNKS